MDGIRLRIWTKDILRDPWAKFDVDNPLDSIKDTVFFRLVEFCYLQVSLFAIPPEPGPFF